MRSVIIRKASQDKQNQTTITKNINYIQMSIIKEKNLLTTSK